MGHKLQFAKNELWNDDCAVQELRVGNVGHSAVDDDTCVQHLERVLRVTFAAEEAPKRLQIQHVALVSAEHQADVCHHEENGQAEKRARAFRHRGMRKNKGSQ